MTYVLTYGRCSLDHEIRDGDEDGDFTHHFFWQLFLLAALIVFGLEEVCQALGIP